MCINLSLSTNKDFIFIYSVMRVLKYYYNFETPSLLFNCNICKNINWLSWKFLHIFNISLYSKKEKPNKFLGENY